jgi:1-acyl-sn-glycerol-3-phosphate acyltransferase
VLKAVSRLLLAPVARLIWRPRILGRRNVPKSGAVLLASNHLSFIDSVVITLVAPRSVSFLAKAEYFTGRGFRGWVSRSFFTSIGAIPVVRGAGSAAQDALDSGLHVLQHGGAFAIYPEGTRSLDGRLYRGRTGVAWLALTSGAVVVPVALTGTQELQPVGSRLPRIRPITVEFGAPLDLSSRGAR